MPRILQALRSLQTHTLGPSAEADDAPRGAGSVSQQPAAQEKQASSEVPKQTVVLEKPPAEIAPQLSQSAACEPSPPQPATPPADLTNEADAAQPAMAEQSAEADQAAPSRPQPPSPLQNELIEKLTRQLAQALKQRDSVAKEVLQIRQTLESRDRRKEEEIVRLRHLLEGHEQSARSIEEELKRQLQRQQEDFVRKLNEFEKRIHPSAAAALPASPPAAANPAPPAPCLLPNKPPAKISKPVVDKPIPQTAPIQAALQELAVPLRGEEISALAQQVFGTTDPSLLAEPLVVFLGTCHPGRSADQAALQLALWFAQQAAGQEVLIIDGALREKTLSQQLGLRTGTGIFEVVRRQNYRRDGLYRDAETGLVFMPAGRSSFLLTPNEQDALALREDLLELLKSWPVILIVGEGPELSASRLFASLAMKTYLQVDLGNVSAPDVLAAIEAYRRLDIEPAGLIATHTAEGCYT